MPHNKIKLNEKKLNRHVNSKQNFIKGQLVIMLVDLNFSLCCLYCQFLCKHTIHTVTLVDINDKKHKRLG